MAEVAAAARPTGKLACRGARFSTSRISPPRPYTRVLEWNFAREGGRPSRAGPFGEGRRPAGPGPVRKACGARAWLEGEGEGGIEDGGGAGASGRGPLRFHLGVKPIPGKF